MKNNTIKFCNESIYPGETLTLALPLPQVFSCAPLYMPIKIIHGKEAGPCLIITAAMYGNEINGSEIIHRLLNLPIISKLQGTLIAVPVLNVHGMINRSRNLPGGIDLNRCFPGQADGSNAERLTHIFCSEVFSKANYCINLQTGPVNFSNLPIIYCELDNPETYELALAFNPPVILDTVLEPGSLQDYAKQLQVPYLTYEAGEAMHFDQQSIKIGVEGILNVMRKLEMLPEKTQKTAKPTLKSLLPKNILTISASSSGTVHSKYKLGQHVTKDETLCMIKDPFGTSENTTLSCPEEGLIVGKNNVPLVHEGDRLFQLAVFPPMQNTASELEEWQAKINH